MHRLCSPDTAPINTSQEDTPMNTTPTSPPPLWQLEEADREAAERARVAEWVAEHPDPVAAALARAVAAEVEVARLRERLVEGDEDEGYSVRCGRAVCDDANPHRSGCRCYKDAEHDGMHGCEHADWPVHGLDHRDRAAQVLHNAWIERCGVTAPTRDHVDVFVQALDTAGLLASPEHDAAVLHEAAAAMEGEDGREWPFDGLDEMQRWLSDRAEAIEREGGAS